MSETETDPQVTMSKSPRASRREEPPPLPDGFEFGGSHSDWMQHLVALRQRAKSAIDRLSDYLHGRKSSPADQPIPGEIHEHLTETLETITMRQDSLEAMMSSEHATEAPPGSASAKRDDSEVPPAWAVQFQSVVSDRLAGFEETLESLCERLGARQPSSNAPKSEDDGLEDTIVDSLELPPDVVQEFSPPAVVPCEDWLGIMLGAELASDERLADSLRWLRENVLAENSYALSLVGQLLVFRCAGAERKPSLLKDVGEAYYRCFPKSKDGSFPFEESLASWSQSLCSEAGLPNSIELVHPGERFDAARHAPVERGGVEVAEVLGWVVLRDGGRVFSKASVLTR